MRTSFPIILLLCCCSLADAEVAAPRSSEEVFDSGRVHTIHLRIPAQAWKMLQPGAASHKPSKRAAAATQPANDDDDVRLRPGQPSARYAYVRSEIDFDGERVTNLGIRLKGNSSYGVSAASPRRPFKLDFERFVDGRHFAGLSSLNLNNAAFDSSQVRETFAFALFRELDVPAPRTGHALVYLTVPGLYDHEYLGLYTLIEEVDHKFLKRNFARPDGLLLKPGGMRGLVYLGDDWSAYKSRYNPKVDASPEQARRVMELAKLINRADDATFGQKIESYVDVDQFLRYLAVNSAITNFDSFLSTGHNYYLYCDPADRRFHFLPWDMNLSFGAYSWLGTAEQTADCSITHAYADHNRLIERLLAIDGYASAYRAHVRRMVDGPMGEPAMRARFEAVAPVFQAAGRAARDVGRSGSAATQPSSGMGFRPTDLRTYVAQRTESIRLQLDGKRTGYLPGFRDPQCVPAEWAPYTAAAVAMMAAADADGDGRLNYAEVGAAFEWIRTAAALGPTGALERAPATAAIERSMTEEMRRRTPAAAWADWLFRVADANKDGRLDSAEILAGYHKLLAGEDRDGDGMLDGRELLETLAGSRAPPDAQLKR
jgi:spore coat protein H